MSALQATVSGHVQGVGFRDATARRARELGLTGWVLNADDGTVQVHAEGSDVDALVEWLRDGPPHAQVTGVRVVAVGTEGHEQFAIRGIPAGGFVVRELTDGGFLLELEVGGDLRRWRLAKEPVAEPAAKRLAIEVADAPDGAGAVWDRGPYEQRGRVAWPEALERGHAMVLLHGERLRGGFALQRTRPGTWLLIKRRDRDGAADRPQG